MLRAHHGMNTMKFLSVAFLGLGLTIFAAEKKAPGAVEATRADPKTKVYPTMGNIERLDPAVDALLGPDARIEKLAGGFEWSEGPVWVPRGKYL